MIFLGFSSDLVSASSFEQVFALASRSRSISICLTASAPMPAEKASSPYSSCAASSSSSVSSWYFSSAVRPGSMTT